MDHGILILATGFVAGAMNALAGGGSFISLPALTVGAASLRTLLVATLIGGALGAVLLLSTPTRAFDLALPWLLLLATSTLAAGPRLGPWLRRHCELKPSALLGVQIMLGVYGGYFGARIGRRIPPRATQRGTLILAACITVAFFARAYQ